MIMDNLPTDILENIVDRLPTEPALRAKQVCKTWRNLLRYKTDKVGLLFILSYPFSVREKKNQLFYGDCNRGKLYRYDAFDGIDDNGMSVPRNKYIDGMLGSCNGLVCFRRQTHDHLEVPFLICNPLTGETVYVPYTTEQKKTYSERGIMQMCGFGYCHTTNEYKIVCSTYTPKPKYYHVQVYTVGGDGWRYKSVNIEKIAKGKSIRTSPVYSAGVYANGAIHWLHVKDYVIATHYTVAAFDLEDETFRFIRFPRLEDVTDPHIYTQIKLVGGRNLYMVRPIAAYEPYCTDIWAYKRKNTGCCGTIYKGMSSYHWIKEFRIEWEEPFRKKLHHHLMYEPLAITRNNEFLFRCCYGAVTAVYCYDLNTSTLHTLLDDRDGMGKINATLHANSIVSMSLKDLEHHRQ